MAHKFLNSDEYIEGFDGGSSYMILTTAVVKSLLLGNEFGVIVVGAGYLRKEK